MKCDRETAIRRLTSRWQEQIKLFPTMATDTPLDMYVAMNLHTVMAYDMLREYESHGNAAVPHPNTHECTAACNNTVPDEFEQVWSGFPDPSDPDNYWIDDVTGERINAHTGERSKVQS